MCLSAERPVSPVRRAMTMHGGTLPRRLTERRVALPDVWDRGAG
jgi:hypothetical protein